MSPTLQGGFIGYVSGCSSQEYLSTSLASDIRSQDLVTPEKLAKKPRQTRTMIRQVNQETLAHTQRVRLLATADHQTQQTQALSFFRPLRLVPGLERCSSRRV